MKSLKQANLLILIVIISLSIRVDAAFSDLFSPRFSTYFTNNEIKTLYQDVVFLSKMDSWKDFGLEELENTDLSGSTPRHLMDWLGKRVKLLVTSDAEATPTFRGKNFGTVYPNQDKIPTGSDHVFTVENEARQTLMANMGTAYYLFGKIQQTVIHLNLEEHFPEGPNVIVLKSPRVGLVEVRKEFFNKDYTISGTGKTDADRILRLSFLFHEGRHSDGNGESLGFYHSECPAGHDYAGRFACDTASNGAYRINATLLNKMSEICKGCSESEKDGLRLAFADARGRILDQNVLGPENQELLNDLENRMNKLVTENLGRFSTATEEEKDEMLTQIEEIELQIHLIKNGTSKKVYWNSEPESLK